MSNPSLWQFLVPLAVGAFAFLAGNFHRHSRNAQMQSENAVYAIGDLHGDAECARKWVHRTGLVENLSPAPDANDDPRSWTWRDNSSSLVFVGDYVDKGPTSRQTVEFVKALTERFPLHVTAIMGNHELELLKDRDSGKDPNFFFQLPYATVHPGEYLNFLPEGREKDEVDDMVVDVLINASIEVYGVGGYRYVRFAPSSPSYPHLVSITEFVRPSSLREVVSERLAIYQRSYIDAFRSDTDLGKWLESRPILHLTSDGTLFVHGGVSAAASHNLKRGLEDVRQLNRQMANHANERALTDFLSQTKYGRLVEELVTYRGNHGDASVCDDLSEMLRKMEGVMRVAVGHTPGETVRITCEGTFLALDSLLGRWIRATGNNYCPMAKKERHSSNGRFKCRRVNDICEGQIVKILDGGVVHVIDDLQS